MNLKLFLPGKLTDSQNNERKIKNSKKSKYDIDSHPAGVGRLRAFTRGARGQSGTGRVFIPISRQRKAEFTDSDALHVRSSNINNA
jgi:hypothetical protein